MNATSSALGLGLALAVVSGLMNGTFTLPMRYLGRWSWENVWALFILVSCLLMPAALAATTVSNLGEALREAPTHAIVLATVCGFAWGFGAIMFGQGVSAIGISLGNTFVLAISLPARTAGTPAIPEQIKAFCVDFNWSHQNKTSGFAPPGHWADASPEKHVRWYKELGANVIQTFAVSCNGYAWYRHGFVPAQPRLKYDFLSDMVRLGHQKGMLVMGYFCVGANAKWGKDHPDLSYGTPYTPHIPFTDPYLDYLGKSMEDAIRKTGMDGYMIDWVWNPSEELRKRGWIPAEQRLFTKLTGKPFPQSGYPAQEDKLAYERKAIDRCWARIKESRDSVNPKCVLWLTANNMADPSIHDSPMLKQVDWLMNESPDMKLYQIARQMAGPQTRLIQNVVGWPTHNTEKFLADPKNRRLDLYGFAMPRANSLPLPIEVYLSKPVDSFTGNGIFSTNDRNIAALARFYHGLPL